MDMKGMFQQGTHHTRWPRAEARHLTRLHFRPLIQSLVMLGCQRHDKLGIFFNFDDSEYATDRGFGP